MAVTVYLEIQTWLVFGFVSSVKPVNFVKTKLMKTIGSTLSWLWYNLGADFVSSLADLDISSNTSLVHGNSSACYHTLIWHDSATSICPLSMHQVNSLLEPCVCNQGTPGCGSGGRLGNNHLPFNCASRYQSPGGVGLQSLDLLAVRPRWPVRFQIKTDLWKSSFLIRAARSNLTILGTRKCLGKSKEPLWYWLHYPAIAFAP